MSKPILFVDLNSWTLNVSSAYEDRIFYERPGNNKYGFNLSSVTAADEGDYCCQVMNGSCPLSELEKIQVTVEGM